jgi:Sulfotransferase domain
MYYCFFGHPKSASTFFGGIMGRVAIELGRKYFYQQIALRGSLQKIQQTNPEFIISQNSSYDAVKKLEKPYKAFHLIRDPRDICVSSYYSYKKTHAINGWKNLQELRDKINEKDIEEAMVEVFEFNRKFFKHMEDWNFSDPDILEFRYEDFIHDPEKTLIRAIEFFGLLSNDRYGFSDSKGYTNRAIHKTGLWKYLRFRQARISKGELEKISAKLSFQSLSKGRTRGDENTDSHYRKGISGDWENFFSSRLKERFKKEYGDLLIKLGYERDSDW